MLRKDQYFIVTIAKKKDIGLKNIGVTDEKSCFRAKCRPKYGFDSVENCAINIKRKRMQKSY